MRVDDRPVYGARKGGGRGEGARAGTLLSLAKCFEPKTNGDSRIGQNMVAVQAIEGANGRAVGERTPVPRIAVLIPCFNEALTIGTVVDSFRAVVPQAKIYVFDNNSTDE